jgi:type VI secretion system protein ImpA
MSSIEKFIGPVTDEKPTGEDITYNLVFLDLENKLKGREIFVTRDGKMESTIEEPNWKEVLDISMGLLPKSRHLRLGVIFSVAALQTQGVTGFRDGLVLLRNWLEKFWDTLYPALDPDDIDPSERMSILQCLSSSADGMERFITRLAEASLCESRTLGKYNLNKIRGITEQAEIAAAFKDADPEKVAARIQAINESIEAAEAIVEFMRQTAGHQFVPNFEELTKTLKELAQCFPSSSTDSQEGTPVANSATPAAQLSGLQVPAASFGPRNIRSRDDVVQTLDAIREYYKVCEPSSPIPFLIERVQRLVKMDFMEVINELAPGAMAQIEMVTGPRNENNNKENT